MSSTPTLTEKPNANGTPVLICTVFAVLAYVILYVWFQPEPRDDDRLMPSTVAVTQPVK